MKKRILFVGYRGKQSHLSVGYECILLTSKKEFRPEYAPEFSEILLVEDLFNWKEVRNALEKVSFDAVVTRFEDFIVPTAAIAENKKLRGIPFGTSVQFRNKFSMKQVFAEKNVPTADFTLIQTLSEAETFLETHTFPLILKQLSGVHSRFVAKVHSKEDLAETLTAFKKEIINEAATLHDTLYNHDRIPPVPNPRTHFLLEECLTGDELSIDAITVEGKHQVTPLCRYVTSEELGIKDHHLPIRILPTNYTPEQERIVHETVLNALDALGVDFCGSHTEVFFKPETNECNVVEVAARPGGFRGEMFWVATNGTFDLNKTCIEISLGNEILLTKNYAEYVAVVEVFSPAFGRLLSFDYSCLEKRKDVQSVVVNAEQGTFVGPASHGGKFIMKFLIHGKEYEKTLQSATKLLSEIRESIQLER